MILAVFWTTFVILGVFFSQKSKIPKNDCFEKVKIERKKEEEKIKDWTTYFKYHI